MVEACNALTPAQEIIPPWAEKDPGYASAVTAPFKDTKFRFGMQQICGCTMLFVVSRKRVSLGEYLKSLEGVLIYDIANFQHIIGKTFHLERKRPKNALYYLLSRCWIFLKLALRRRAAPVSSVFACLLCDTNNILKPRTACSSTRMTSEISRVLSPGLSRQISLTWVH